MERVEEAQLIQRAQQGDSEAFAGLYRAHVQTIFRYVSARVNDPHTAEDLTADVFTKALSGLAGYQEMGRPFVAWLYTIAHARVVDFYRRRSERQHDQVPETLGVTPNMDARILRRQAAEALSSALGGLTSEQQQVILLRFVEGHRIEAVAELMGKNANAVKALQHRALRALAARLARAGLDVEAILAGLG